MNMTFFNDTKFKYNGEYYFTNGGLNNTFLKEYLNYFDKITLVTRKENINKKTDISNFSRVDLNQVCFDCINNLNIFSIFFGNYNKTIMQNVKNSDFIIIRLPSIIGVRASHYCNKFNKKYLIEMVGCPFDSLWNYGGIKAKLIAPFFALITRNIIKKSNNVLYVSNSFLQKRYPNRNNTIGVSDVKIEKVDNKILEKRIIKIDNYKKNNIYKFGLVGSLKVNYKGHDTAIKAMSLLKNKINFQLHFLGASDEKSIEKWKKLSKRYGIEDRVFYDGVLPGGEPVLKWMDNMDLYLIPSLTEGLPRSLVEAMSRASICIGTRAGGITELLEKDVLIEKKDYKSMSTLILNLISNKEKMKKISQRNFNFSKNYEESSLKLKRANFYKNILK